jgi:hypothetical protein
MKLSRRQLRRLISGAINEHRTMPDISSVPSQQLDKIHDLIDSGDVEMARSLIDAFGGPTDYPEAYIAYNEVGDMEKLGGEAAELLDRPPSGAHILDDMKPIYDIDDKARALADKKALRDFPAVGFPDDFPTDEVILPDQYDAQQTHLDRYYNARNRKVDRTGYFDGNFIKENMKISRRQLDRLIFEYSDFMPRDFRQADAIVFLEYLDNFIKSGLLNPDAEIDLIYPENAPAGKYYISLTQQELVDRIPKLINQINMSLGGEDAFPVKDNSGAFGTSPAGLKSYQRDDLFKQLTIYIPMKCQTTNLV